MGTGTEGIPMEGNIHVISHTVPSVEPQTNPVGAVHGTSWLRAVDSP
tara:strand:+ start:826 stop:966 length:141 start_codon:yes stop_codon:yes gene_type:complete